jgi:hypothetical protein
MTEITLRLKDEVIKEYGEVFIKEFFEKQIEYLGFLRAMDKIETQVKASGIDYDTILENIRQEAWDNYKGDFLSPGH